MVDGDPICIVSGCGKTVSNIMAYLNGYDVIINDGKIKSLLDKLRLHKTGAINERTESKI